MTENSDSTILVFDIHFSGDFFHNFREFALACKENFAYFWRDFYFGTDGDMSFSLAIFDVAASKKEIIFVDFCGTSFHSYVIICIQNVFTEFFYPIFRASIGFFFRERHI